MASHRLIPAFNPPGTEMNQQIAPTTSNPAGFISLGSAQRFFWLKQELRASCTASGVFLEPQENVTSRVTLLSHPPQLYPAGRTSLLSDHG